MLYLIQSRPSSSARPTSQKDGINIIEEFIFPALWPRMETHVIPLTTFDTRMHSLLPRLEELRAQVHEIGMSAAGGNR